MTRSLTLAGLPRAGAKSTPHSNKQKKTKNEGPSENMGFQRENRLKISDEKKIKHISSLDQTTPWNA